MYPYSDPGEFFAVYKVSCLFKSLGWSVLNSISVSSFVGMGEKKGGGDKIPTDTANV